MVVLISVVDAVAKWRARLIELVSNMMEDGRDWIALIVAKRSIGGCR